MSRRPPGQDSPRLDTRRSADFAAELRTRARAWIPGWELDDGVGDFGRALLDIAARFNAEVAERLDNAGDKMRRGFLDWLAVRGEAARPARMPVAFRLADAATNAVLAEAPVRLQVDAGGTPVVFETERDVRIVPGRVEALVAVDIANDAYYVAPSGVLSLDPLEPAPARWQPRSYVSAGTTTFQLDPEGGLAEGTVIDAAGRQYRVVAVEKDLVTISPPLDTDLTQDVVVTKVDRLTPFDAVRRNWQEHALYLGDAELLNIEAAATIEVMGANALRTGVAWEYWGKVDGNDEVGWQSLDLVAPQPPNGGVFLKKGKGAVEVREIAGRSGRWIRAHRASSEASITADEFTLHLNSVDCANATDVECPKDDTYVSPPSEGMANTTPLVLENTFFPLGREPRQFDAFYLGSKEAFSKANATARLCFEMADPRFKVIAALRGGPFPDLLFAGVAADGHLHLMVLDPSGPRLVRIPNRLPVRPPSPDLNGGPVGGPPVTLDRASDVRPAAWMLGLSQAFIAVTAGSDVWLWRENGSPQSQSGWLPLGPVSAPSTTTPTVSGLVYLADGAQGYLFALRDRKLFVCNPTSQPASWQEVSVKVGGTSIELSRIAPVQVEALSRGGSLTEGMVGISPSGRLYGIAFANPPVTATATQLLAGVDPAIAPAATRRTDNRLVAMAIEATGPSRKVLAFRSAAQPRSFQAGGSDDAELEWAFDGASVDANIVGGEVTAAFSLTSPTGERAVALWSPMFVGQTPLYRTKIASSNGTASGSPTLLPQHLMVPSTSGEVLLASVDVGRRQPRVAPLGTVFAAESAADRLVTGDHVAFFDGTATTLPLLKAVTNDGQEVRRKVYHQFDEVAVTSDTFVYKATDVRTGTTRTAHDELKLQPGQTGVQQGTFLLIDTDPPPAAPRLYEVMSPVANGVATLDRDLEFTAWPGPNTNLSYRVPATSSIEMLPMLKFNPPATWDAAVLDRTQLTIPSALPRRQDGVVIDQNSSGLKAVALGTFWTGTQPASPITYIVDESIGTWSRQLADTSTNPELSWEYWNGTGWWTLGAVRDDTQNLKRSGGVTFTVPADLRESDWSGKTNFWIRARLIGGDYGQEKVTVITTPIGGGKTEQTVERSTDGIRAPSVLRLQVRYRLCTGTPPTFVVTEDSGSFRDQSDANKTAGAVVAAFVPLREMFAGFAAAMPAAGTSGPSAPGDCDCSRGTPAHATRDGAVTAGNRALMVGVSGRLTGASVNLLVLVDERPHGALAPLTVEALVADRFERIVASDDTRALGESGVLTMAFPQEPSRRELFGRSLTWLKLTPQSGSTAPWTPSIRGAHLNAAWASATETLTRELLGSSDGAPGLTFRLARPPVLRGTLELRVREPLGDEDRAALVKNDPAKVTRYADGLDGDWVRWDPVVDPDDASAGARVYAFDEGTGDVRFGNGLHGMIPPIGRDSIVAFRYQRTEPPQPGSDVVPANSVAARTPLNLVTPVETVEAVVAADQAAGGAPPESVDRVVRFGFAKLRHRRRVLTERDLEDMALQASPDVTQARAFTRRGGVRLLLVMKGSVPAPTAAQAREIRRVLLEGCSDALAQPGALTIQGPAVRFLRIDLRLRVESLDRAAALSKSVNERLTAFFDTGTGGLHGRGWPLGASPSDDDVVLALSEATYLDGIVDVRLREVDRHGGRQPWPEALKPTEIVMLAPDFVGIDVETAEVLA